MNKYAKELTEMLNKDSVEAMEEFIKAHSGYEIRPVVALQILNLSPERKQLMLWQLQAQCVSVKKSIKNKAVVELFRWRATYDSKRNKRNKSESSNDKD